MRTARAIQQPHTRDELLRAGVQPPMPPPVRCCGRDAEGGRGRLLRHPIRDRLRQRQPPRRSELDITVHDHPGPPLSRESLSRPTASGEARTSSQTFTTFIGRSANRRGQRGQHDRFAVSAAVAGEVGEQGPHRPHTDPSLVPHPARGRYRRSPPAAIPSGEFSRRQRMSVAGSLRPSRLVARMTSSLSLAILSSIDLGAATYRGIVPAVWHVAVRGHSSRASAGTPRSLIGRPSTQRTISERFSRLVSTSRGAHRGLSAPALRKDRSASSSA